MRAPLHRRRSSSSLDVPFRPLPALQSLRSKAPSLQTCFSEMDLVALAAEQGPPATANVPLGASLRPQACLTFYDF